MGDSASTVSKATPIARAMIGALPPRLGSIQTVSNCNELLIRHFSEGQHDRLDAFVKN